MNRGNLTCLKQGPGVTPQPCFPEGRQDMVVVFTTGGSGRCLIIGGISIRLVHRLPGKPAEDTTFTVSLISYSGGAVTDYNSYSVQFSCSVLSDSLQPHGLQDARPPCPSPSPGVYSNPCPLSRWCHPTISSSASPSSHLQSFPTSGSFQMSQLFTSGGQSIGVSASASVLPMNIQDWFPLG